MNEIYNYIKNLQLIKESNDLVIKENKDEQIQLVILTSSTNGKGDKVDKAPTVIKIEDICKKKNIKCYVVYSDIAIIDKTDKGKIFIKNINEKGIEISPENTVILVRRGVVFHKYSLNLLSRLERMGFFTLNNRDSIEVCEDKYWTSLKLVDSGLSIPKTSIIPNENFIDICLEKVGGKFPVVVKTLSGTKGIGVFIVSDYKSLRPVLQTIWSISSETEVLIQEYIENDYDVRIHVLGDNVIASMKRNKIENDFRTNVSLGGTTDIYKPSKEMIDIAIKAAKSVQCLWCGVDLMIDRKGNIYILEVNASPGTDGIEKISKVKVSELVLDFISDKNNWKSTSKECGIKEMIEIDGIGNLLGKFDTGNSVHSCSIDAQEIKIKNNKVTWKTLGKSYTKEIIDEIKLKSNHSPNDDYERYVINLDIKFNGITYKNTPFNLSNRIHKKSKVLINKEFMKKAGLVINPAKEFVLSINPD